MTNQTSIRKIRKALRLFERELDRHKSENCCQGVTFKQCHTLLAIDDEGNTNISDLSKILNLDKSTISRTVDGLVNLSFVDRIIPEDNRRSTLISLTPKGQQLSDSINRINDTYFEEIFKTFTKDEIEIFASLFMRTSQNMLEYQISCECKNKTN